MNQSSTIFVAGHRGLVGSAICRKLAADGYTNVVTAGREHCDLRSAAATLALFDGLRPDYVFLAAARVGGIMDNATRPGEFIGDNLAIQLAVINSALATKVKRFCFLGSSCIYPRHCPQPIREEYLNTGPLEPTNSAYAVAKLAGVEMLSAYRQQYGFNGVCLMPSNVYGPGDNYRPERSHVLAAMIRRMHAAKDAGDAEVTAWGTGTPRREFLYADDLAEAAVFAMNREDCPPIVNVGTGQDYTIADLAEAVAATVGFKGRIRFDPSKPDGTPRKLLDISRLAFMGWQAKTPLIAGLKLAYEAYLRDEIDRHEEWMRREVCG